MGTHRPIPIAAARRPFSADIFAETAERIQRSLRRNASLSADAVAALIVDTLEQASGERISDQVRFARQLLLWHRTYPPEQARALTVAALADRAGALRRSVLHRRHAPGSRE